MVFQGMYPSLRGSWITSCQIIAIFGHLVMTIGQMVESAPVGEVPFFLWLTRINHFIYESFFRGDSLFVCSMIMVIIEVNWSILCSDSCFWIGHLWKR